MKQTIIRKQCQWQKHLHRIKKINPLVIASQTGQSSMVKNSLAKKKKPTELTVVFDVSPLTKMLNDALLTWKKCFDSMCLEIPI